MKSIAFAMAVVAAAAATACSGGSRSSSEGSSRDGGLNCSELRVVARAGIEATTVGAVYEKDMCWNDGGRAVYEAFVRSPGQSGRSAHFKFTFNGLDARSGVQQLCQDARTGVWECGP